MNTLTQKLQQEKEQYLEVLDYAKEIIAYFGARNDGKLYQDDYLLQVIDSLRDMKEYIKSLCDNADALELENEELKAEAAK